MTDIANDVIIEDPVTENRPKDWLSEQQLIASDALAKLTKHYPGWKWGIEFVAINGKSDNLGAMMLRLLDVPTDLCHMIQYKDIDRDNLRCVIRAGGAFLEALGLSRSKWKYEEIRGLKKTAAGLIIPDYAAFPEGNPGYEKAKKEYDKAYYPKDKKVV